jgi:hypothetical protein
MITITWRILWIPAPWERAASRGETAPPQPATKNAAAASGRIARDPTAADHFT